MGTTFLIDGNHMVFRSYYILQFRSFQTADGFFTGTIFGFLNIIKGLCRAWDPSEMAILWDLGKSEYRLSRFEKYKERVEGTGPGFEFYEQIEVLQSILNMMGIVQLGILGVEADDLFGIITNDKRLMKKYDKVIMVSSDSDFQQLLKGTKVVQYDPIKKVLLDEVVLRKRGLAPSQIIDYKALSGDSSDGVPGIHGIGPGTAKKLLEKYGSIDKFDLEELSKKKSTKRIVEEWDKLLLWKDLVTIFTDTSKLSEVQRQTYEDWVLWMRDRRESMLINKKDLLSCFKKLEFKWSSDFENFLMNFSTVVRGIQK